MNTKRSSRDYIVRAAMTLLVMLLTSATAWAETVKVPYVDGNGEHEYETTVTITENAITDLGNGWYVMSGEITLENTLEFNQTVNLILADGADVKINGANGITVNGSLTIYGQSKGTGSLTIDTDRSGDGIFVDNGGITINGGILTITADQYGITTNNGDITINGGIIKVTATNENGIDATGNITLGYTKDTDHIFASSYGVTSDKSISICSGKTMIDGETLLFRGTISPSDIKNKILAPDLFGISNGNDGSSSRPYTITSPAGLKLLATYVNSGKISSVISSDNTNVYSDKFFKLNNDIAFIPTIDNFIPIGGKPTNNKYAFCGSFDGEGHSISGINIYYTDKRYVGLFGLIGEGSTVKNVTLDYANISGYDFTGGIAGYNDRGNITNCLVTNSTISGDINAGAIIGGHSGTLKYNYYNNSSVNNNKKNVGSHDGDIGTMDGAKLATILSELESVPTPLSGIVVFRREFTGGSPSTICLPFAYTPEASDGTFYTFTGIEKVEGKWVATMTKVDGALAANTPYIIVPDENRSIVPVLFHGDADSDSDPSTSNGNWTFQGTYEEIKWNEDNPPVGIYGFSAQAVAAQDIYQGQFVKVGEYVKIRPLRAYLQYTGSNFPNTRGTLSEEELPDRILVRLVDSDGDITGIGELDMKTGEVTFDNGWYTLEGVRLSGKPAKHGIYVNNGRKCMIK